MINELLSIIDDLQIKLVEKDMTSINLKGLYLDNIIVIEKKLENDAERASIIAEEIGHHFTATDNILDQSSLHNQKEEEKAHRWAAQYAITPVKLIKAFEAGISSRYELAEFLGVTEVFIENSLPLLQKLYGNLITINEYTINLDPLWIYKSFE